MKRGPIVGYVGEFPPTLKNQDCLHLHVSKMTVQMDTHILANDTNPNFLKCLLDKNTFETDPKPLV